MTKVYIDKRPTYAKPMWTWVVVAADDGYEYDAFDRKMDALDWCKRSKFEVIQKP